MLLKGLVILCKEAPRCISLPYRHSSSECTMILVCQVITQDHVVL